MNSGSLPLPRKILVCFAVKQEAAPFRRAVAGRDNIDILITGIGARNAEQAIEQTLHSLLPQRVVSAGFAGGLDPQLKEGDVVFQVENEPQFAAALSAAGARFVRFHCAANIVTTAQEKRILRQTSAANAVEMESQHICTICSARRISCATVRVILDTADEDLPLDFNQLMSPDRRLVPARLVWTLVKAPGKIGALRRLGQRSEAAAEKLAKVLLQVLDNRQ